MFKKIEILLMIMIALFVIGGNIFFYFEKNEGYKNHYENTHKFCINAFYYNYFGCMNKAGYTGFEKI